MNKPRNHLPDHARIAFKGVMNEVWQWDQKMYDGTTKTFEKIKKPDTVSVIALVGDKIIIQHQEQPHRDAFLSLPGGFCEKDESPENTARRELLEETGYDPSALYLWKIIPNYASSIIRNSHYFIAKNCSKKQEPIVDNGEKITSQLIDFETFILLSENELFRDHEIAHEILKLRLHPEMLTMWKTELFT